MENIKTEIPDDNEISVELDYRSSTVDSEYPLNLHDEEIKMEDTTLQPYVEETIVQIDANIGTKENNLRLKLEQEYDVPKNSRLDNSPNSCVVCGKIFDSADLLMVHFGICKGPKESGTNSIEYPFNLHDELIKIEDTNLQPYVEEDFVKNKIKDQPEIFHSKNSPDSCVVCNEIFDGADLFKAHVTLCKGTQQPNTNVLENPLNLHDDLIKIEDTAFQPYVDEDLPTEEIHFDGKKFTCDDCQTSFRDAHTLIVHKRTHTIERAHKCDVCLKKFTTKVGLMIHKRWHTTDQSYECDVCQKNFFQQKTLTLHQAIHTGERPFGCEQCYKKFSRRSTLIAHRRVHSSHKPYHCDECGMKFSRTFNMRKHMRTHTNDRPFTCDLCPKTFATAAILVNHKRTHTGERPYACDMCERKFSRKNSLMVHKQVHSSANRCTCYLCKKTFSRKAKLLLHMKLHTSDPQHQCDQCEMRFYQKNQMKAHKLVHTNDPQFTCDVCKKKFFRKGSLTVHQRKHTTEPEFECEHCKKKFIAKKYLTEHTGIHIGFSFKCDMCDKTFRRHYLLSEHKLLHNSNIKKEKKKRKLQQKSEPAQMGPNFNTTQESESSRV